MCRVGGIVKEDTSSVFNKMPHFGLCLSLYLKIGLTCSVFNCARVVEFAFGVVQRGMTGSDPSLGNI